MCNFEADDIWYEHQTVSENVFYSFELMTLSENKLQIAAIVISYSDCVPDSDGRNGCILIIINLRYQKSCSLYTF